MRRIALAALLVAFPALARGEVPEHGDPVAVRATLDGISARIVVDYRVHTADPAEIPLVNLTLPLPPGAVVTGATLTHRGVAHRMTLGSGVTVEQKFQAAFGGGGDSDAAPTIWVAKLSLPTPFDRTYSVELSLGAPVRSRVDLSLEIFAPTCFFHDRRYVRAPSEWKHVARTRQPSTEVARACAHPDAGEGDPTWLSFPAAPRPAGERASTTTARLAVDNELHLARTELALAEQLADIPRDLATVILVDESRSLTDQQRRAQREVALAYLRAVPNSRVQVLAFSRRARPLLPAWTVASRATTRLERELAAMTPRNGSNFDVGLADAGRALSAIAGTRRVLLVTDEAMADRLANQPAQLADLVPPGTLIHVVVTSDLGATADDGNAILARHDGARLASLAAATTGMATAIGELPIAQRAPLDATILARPISLDHVHATGLGWTELDVNAREGLAGHSCTGSIPAGESCVWWTRGSRFAGPIQIEGLAWNQRVVRLVRPLSDPRHTIAREIVGSGVSISDDTHPDGEDDERVMTRIDALALAVTATTSLFVRWGGVSPFLEGFGYGGLGRSETIGTIGRTHVGTGVGGTRIPAIDLAPQLRPLVAHCNLGGQPVVVTLEITLQEIVDVDVSIDGDARRCIEDAVWDFAPTLPSVMPSRRFQVRL